MTQTVAVILARGGSKGIPRKNLVDLCGRPLLVWSILSAVDADGVDSVWVSSDDDEILSVSAAAGANTISRPIELADDVATSESGWVHALDVIERDQGRVDLVVGLQATSPLRTGGDIDKAIADRREQECDSLLSVEVLDDFLIWQKDASFGYSSVNYDYRNRGRRQDRELQYHENGSIYVFTPELLRRKGNRLGGRIGVSVMPAWRSLQIDSPEDLELCTTIMLRYMLGGE